MAKLLGINDLAKKMGVKPATARGILRKKKEKRKGKAYAWTASELNAVAKRLKAA